MKIKLLLLLIVTLLTGCATQNALDTWRGATSDEVILTYGPPDIITSLSDGSEIIAFKHSNMAYNYTHWCDLGFVVNTQGIVTKTRMDGNIGGCNAYVKTKKMNPFNNSRHDEKTTLTGQLAP